MSIVISLFILAVLVGGLEVWSRFLDTARPSEARKRLRYRVRIVGGIIALFAIIGEPISVWMSQSPITCTPQALEELIRSGVTARLNDPVYRDSLQSLAGCVASETVLKTAKDSALVQIGLGNYRLAQVHLSYALLSSPSLEDRAELYFYLGVTYQFQAGITYEGRVQRGDELFLIESIAHYDSALTLCHNAYSAWFNRGYSLAALGNYSAAIASFDSVIVYKPDHKSAWYNRGLALRMSGEYGEAIGSFDRSLSLLPTDAKSWYERGLALRQMRQHRAALTSFDSALVYGRELAPIWLERGVTLAHLRYDELAVASYDSALERQHDLSGAWYDRGLSLAELNRYADAVPSFDSAICYRPAFHAAWHNRGLSLIFLGRDKEGIESYDSALVSFRADPETWFCRANADILLGDRTQARADADSALCYGLADTLQVALRALLAEGTNTPSKGSSGR